MVEEIFTSNDVVQGRSRDLVELISMLGDATVAATVKFHGDEYQAIETLLATSVSPTGSKDGW